MFDWVNIWKNNKAEEMCGIIYGLNPEDTLEE